MTIAFPKTWTNWWSHRVKILGYGRRSFTILGSFCNGLLGGMDSWTQRVPWTTGAAFMNCWLDVPWILPPFLHWGFIVGVCQNGSKKKAYFHRKLHFEPYLAWTYKKKEGLNNFCLGVNASTQNRTKMSFEAFECIRSITFLRYVLNTIKLRYF